MTSDTLRSYPSYDAAIDCSGTTHQLRWEAGNLRAVDHADAEGERALAALGGDRCACVDTLDAWARHADDLRVLILTSRGSGDELRWPDQPAPRQGMSFFPGGGAPIGTMVARIGVAASGSTGFAATNRPTPPPLTSLAGRRAGGGYVQGPGTPQPFSDEDDLSTLLALDAGLAHRLAVTVAAAWAARLNRPDPQTEAARVALTAALHGRMASTIRGWLTDRSIAVHVDMLDEATPPAIARSNRDINVAVPFGWIPNVWGRGIAVIWDRLTLDILSSSADHLTLTTVDSALHRQRTLNIALE